MFIISKLNLVKIKYKMYKNLLFIKNNYWRTYVRLKTYEHYNINTRVLRAVLQSDNNGLPDWFIYMATYSEGHCLLFQNTRGIKSRTKQILFDRTLGQSAKFYEYTHTLRTARHWWIQPFPLHILSHFIMCRFIFYFKTLHCTCEVSHHNRSINFNVAYYCVFGITITSLQ